MNLYHCPNCDCIGLHEDLYEDYQTWFDGDYRDEYTSYTCPLCGYEGGEDDFEVLDEI
jgi:hypothetical protein